jgi:hypothetical protein
MSLRRRKGKKTHDDEPSSRTQVVEDEGDSSNFRDADEDLVDLYGESETNWGKGRQIAVIISLARLC